MAEGVAAFIVHQSPGRLRLKIPAKRGDRAYFARLAERLAACSGITAIDGRAHTGTVLVLHAPTLAAADITAFAERTALFSPRRRPPPSLGELLERANARIHTLERGFSTATSGALDRSSILFWILLALAIRQAARGKALMPAFSLLWWAWDWLASRKPVVG
ncbi:hypothetical protein [Candidatus Methylocalor cossyra]|uniref:Uncharacterized protein n=1 Tax=Candidatus Methylocalor cossyra TaxID=3108543 RepID=A0ABM9NM00_9GAMM